MQMITWVRIGRMLYFQIVKYLYLHSQTGKLGLKCGLEGAKCHINRLVGAKSRFMHMQQ